MSCCCGLVAVLPPKVNTRIYGIFTKCTRLLELARFHLLRFNCLTLILPLPTLGKVGTLVYQNRTGIGSVLKTGRTKKITNANTTCYARMCLPTLLYLTLPYLTLPTIRYSPNCTAILTSLTSLTLGTPYILSQLILYFKTLPSLYYKTTKHH